LAGFSGASTAVNNSISVQEEYAEVRVPIAQKQPFADDLYVDAGYRYSNYSTSGAVSTYKFGGQWSPVAAPLYAPPGSRSPNYSPSGAVSPYKFGGQWSPVPDFTLRGSYARAI